MDSLNIYLQVLQTFNVVLRVNGSGRHNSEFIIQLTSQKAVSMTFPAEDAVLNVFGAGEPL
jgi:hypothetical protein